MVRIGNIDIVNDLRVVGSYCSEIGYCNILGPDTNISTQVLPEGQCRKYGTVEQYCLRREKKNFNMVSSFAILEWETYT